MILTDIKNAIIKNLHNAFSGFEIYSSPTEQGVQAPCFFITWKETKELQDFGKFYFRIYTFDIDYFPPLDGSMNDEEISESLFDVLEWIKIDKYPIRCISSSADAKLIPFTFTVSYKIRVIKKEDSQNQMIERLEQNINAKD